MFNLAAIIQSSSSPTFSSPFSSFFFFKWIYFDTRYQRTDLLALDPGVNEASRNVQRKTGTNRVLWLRGSGANRGIDLQHRLMKLYSGGFQQPLV